MINPNKLGGGAWPYAQSQVMLVGVSGVTPPASPHLLDTLISYWKLDEATGATRNDSKGTNHLTDINSCISAAALINDGAIPYLPTLSYLTHASNSDLQVTGDFTFSVWIKFSDVSGGSVIRKGGDYIIFLGSGQASIYVATFGGAGANAATPAIITTGAWFHIVAWYEHATQLVSIKVNDGTTYTSSLPVSVVQTAGAFFIGTTDGATGYTSGYIDEIGFWKRLLTAAEITALYNSGAGLPYSSFTAQAGATGYSMSGPSSGTVGVASSNFTVTLTPSGGTSGSVTITPSDGGGGGTFTPSTVALSTGTPSATFTYTAGSAGVKTISATNSGSLTNPSNLSYTATVAALSDGDPVSSWTDSSGNGHTATQSGAARPIFKTAILNGKPVVRFSVAGTSKMAITTPISAAGPYTMFAVMKPTTASDNLFTLTSDTAAGADNLAVCELSADMVFFSVNARLGYLTPNAFDGAFHVFEAGINSAAVGLAVDGTVQAPATGANTATDNFAVLGYRRATPTYSNGDIAEILLYNLVIAYASADEIAIRNYLLDKWFGTPGSFDPSTVSGLVAWWKADSL